MRVRLFCFYIGCSIFALFSGCDRAAPSAAGGAPDVKAVSTTAPSDRAADRWDVLEAVYRHQFVHNASAAQQNVKHYFLCLDEYVDPPAEFMARFAGHTPSVFPVSATEGSDRVKHKQTQARGLLFGVISLAWIDKNTAQVEGGYYEGNLSSSSNVYRVEKRGKDWVVTEDKLISIS